MMLETDKDCPKCVERFFDHADKTQEYVDNYRWCYVGDKVGEERYAKSKARGCCAFHDDIIYDENKRMIKVGYNFGH